MSRDYVINDMDLFTKSITDSLIGYPVTFEMVYDTDIRITFISLTTGKRSTLHLSIRHKFTDFYGDRAATAIIEVLSPTDIVSSRPKGQAG